MRYAHHAHGTLVDSALDARERLASSLVEAVGSRSGDLDEHRPLERRISVKLY
jgi:hypothetical protein